MSRGAEYIERPESLRSTSPSSVRLSALRDSDLVRPGRWWSHRRDPEVWAWCLAGMCVVLLGMRQSFLLRGTGGMTPAQVAVLGALVVVTAGAAFCRDKIDRVPTAAAFVLIALALSSLITYASVCARGASSVQLLYIDHALFAQVLGIALVLLIVILIRTPRAVILTLRGVVVAGAISAFYAVLQTFGGIDLAPDVRIPVLLKADTATLVTDLMRAGTVRPQGASGHPLELSAILTILTPIADGVTLHARARHERWIPWALACMLIMGGALTTVSRSAVVGMVIAIAVFACAWPVKRTLVVVVSTVAAVFLALQLRIPMINQLYQVVTGGSDDNSFGSRTFGQDYVWRHFTDHLWFGQGMGTYDVRFQPVLDNEYLGRLMERGVVGLVSFVALLVVGIAAAAIATRRALREGDRASVDLYASLAASLAALATISTILDISGFLQISTLMYVLIGVSIALVTPRTSDDVTSGLSASTA